MSKKIMSALLLLTFIFACGFTCQKKYPTAKPEPQESEEQKSEDSDK